MTHHFLEDHRLTGLLAEYTAMYQLASLRLGALDRRVPVGVGALAAFLGSAAALPVPSREAVLVAVPLATVWLLRTTLAHLRGFEDAISRIAELEAELNARLGADILRFQSRHPSKESDVGGRTGSETVRTTLASSMVLLAACSWLAAELVAWTFRGSLAYSGYVLAVGYHLTRMAVSLRSYRWRWRQ